ncbi:MAG TPA: hypothetical protein VKH19_04225 [Gemmatimonadaceae bacterium]|nr:hypothetical protein [Gemmatimonadaceae bacterium]
MPDRSLTVPQTSAPTPTTPTTPTAPAAPQPYVVTLPSGTPTTREEMLALEHKRSQLSDQLTSAAGRRRSLANELRSADGASRVGIEARMRVLDDRIVKLEQELDRTGDQLANVPGNVIATTQMPAELARSVSKDFVPIVAILSVFVLGPFAIAMSRLIWKRGSAPRPPVVDSGTQQRLEQLQQSVDTIAVEVERISESQRFVTRLLSESHRPLSAGAAPAEPIALKKSAVER